MRRIDTIVVHCSATREGKDYTVEDIRRWHKDRGYSDIGYHYVVYRDGSIHEGRPLELPGAHVKGHNARSIGICYVGGLDSNVKSKDTRTPQQKASLLSLIKKLKRDYPHARVVGHRDLSPDRNGNGKVDRWEWLKDCPCFDAEGEYKGL